MDWCFFLGGGDVVCSPPPLFDRFPFGFVAAFSSSGHHASMRFSAAVGNDETARRALIPTFMYFFWVDRLNRRIQK